ncbi:hypothetical protein LMG27952_06790 [Paraburkholderia hiiakae]|uniref:Uncharacterized protein n=1 Tax=Paraburkholderia hiiakae TaxID=1081782 RepID=A0ABN7ICM1_9BURK|nr:hypothetical protein LMG27952_06790 [Paraburkholderia hiiakae]
MYSLPHTGAIGLASTPKLAFTTIASTLAYLGLAILGSGGFSAFFSHRALTLVAMATLVMAGVGVISAANLSASEREDRGNRWVLAASGTIGILSIALSAYTDGFWVFDGDNLVRPEEGSQVDKSVSHAIP